MLISAKFSKYNAFSILCFVKAGVALIACFVVATHFGGTPAWAFEGMSYGYYWFFIGIAVFVWLGITLASARCELIVSEGKVTGKTLFEKRVDLPISQISAAGTGMYNRVSIATSSGSINFYGVINKEEVFSVISELLMKRQEETKTTVKVSDNVSDELKKMKELFDGGIITQEEFDAKKKQLLGL